MVGYITEIIQVIKMDLLIYDKHDKLRDDTEESVNKQVLVSHDLHKNILHMNCSVQVI